MALPVYGISVYKAKGLGNVDVFQTFCLFLKNGSLWQFTEMKFTQIPRVFTMYRGKQSFFIMDYANDRLLFFVCGLEDTT